MKRLLIGLAGTGIGGNKPQPRRRKLMRKLIIAPIALLFVAALVLALGAPPFNGRTPVYAHVGDTNCSGGAHDAFGLGSHDGTVVPGLGRGFGALTAVLATDGLIPGGVAALHSVGCDPSLLPPP